MPRPNTPGSAQRIFLKRLRDSHGRLGADEWPSAPLLRRWMKQPPFLRALRETRDVCRFRSDFELSIASARASEVLRDGMFEPEPCGADPLRRHQQLIQLLRIAHLRTRFTQDPPEPPTRREMTIAAFRAHLRSVHESLTVKQLCEQLDFLLEGKPNARKVDEFWPSPWALTARDLERMHSNDARQIATDAAEPDEDAADETDTADTL